MAAEVIDTGTEQLRAEVEDGVAVLTMNRPERRNALSGEMLDALGTALARIERDDAVGCVVLTGAGGAFCAGGDVKEMAASGGFSAGARQPGGGGLDARIRAQREVHRSTAGRLYCMPKPVIAAIPGAAAGAGLSLALACDLRVMADDAIVTTAFARVGFSGDFGGTFFLTQLVGSAKARELFYLPERLNAAQCLALGLANRVVPADTLISETAAWARRIASGPRIAYRYMKENLNRAVGGDVLECLDMEAIYQIQTGLTEDHREAAQAFVEKREPAFKGR
jgi:2-(1,2-epoxy-1,2-dihydrophenyl)acetyl-CoA isomerase